MLDKVKEGVLFMKTHELEKELGISKHTIFYYEKEGIVTPQRDENGYRSYTFESSLFPNDTIPVNNETTPKAVKQTNSAMM